MFDLDPSLWTQVPAWIISLFVLVKIFGWLFTTLAPSGVKAWWVEIVRSRQHDDEIEEARVHAELNNAATLQLQKKYTDDMLFDLLASNLEWQKELFKELNGSFKALTAELRNIHLTNQRQNDLLTTTNINIAELIDLTRHKKANGAVRGAE